MPRSEPLNLLEELKRLEKLRVPKRSTQRRFQRFRVRADAELHPMDASQYDRTPLEIKLRDIGRGGIGFVCETPLAIGSVWRIDFMQRGYVIGRQAMIVRYCCDVRDGLYLIGAQFCIDTGLLMLLGIDAGTISDEEASHPADDFLSPNEV